MAYYELSTADKGLFKSIQDLLLSLMQTGVVDLLTVPHISPYGKGVLPTLVGNVENDLDINIFVPYLPYNAARSVGEATINNPGKKIGLVLRSCEIRAVVELAKLKQVDLTHVYLIGVDCLGTYEAKDFQALLEQFDDHQKLTEDFLSASQEARPKETEGHQLRQACLSCEHPVSPYLDMGIHFLGLDPGKSLLIQTREDLSEEQQTALELTPTTDTAAWEEARKNLETARRKYKDELFEQVAASLGGPHQYLKQLDHCRRCYNCRKECPICYCRECIFESKTFEHQFADYFRWVKRKGKVRVPADTLLFHLTRLNHMVSSCVACGQCSSACPNGIEVARVFKYVGQKVQDTFEYVPGRNPEEEVPLSTFKEDEFPTVGAGNH